MEFIEILRKNYIYAKRMPSSFSIMFGSIYRIIHYLNLLSSCYNCNNCKAHKI